MKILVADLLTWSEVSVRPRGHTHLFRQFLKHGYEGAWVSSPHDVGRLLAPARRQFNLYQREWRRGFHHGSEDVWAFTPFAWLPFVNMPVLRSSWTGRNSLRWTWPSTSRSLSHAGFDRPDVLWVGTHRVASVGHCVKPRNIVYRMYDLATGFPNQPDSTEQLEAELCRRSTVVFAVSQKLVERARQWTDRVVYLPNAAHIDAFDGPPGPEPSDLAEIPHPRIIYMGGLGPYVDTKAFEETARARPDVHIVIVGEPSACFEDRFRQLPRLPNIHFLGPRRFDTIPSYLRHCDAGLITDVPTELRHAASPLKLYEYAAAGLPVVSSTLHETQYVGSGALFYETPEECVQRVDEALANRETLGTSMRAFAERNTWDMRYETVMQALAKYGDINGE